VANIHQLPAVMQESGVDSYRMSTDAATICRQLVVSTALEIQGRKYVRVEGWQAIAIAHHCTASSCNVERVDGGFRATGQVRRMDTGAVIAEAEGFVGEDEAVWFGGEVTDKWGKKKVHPKRPDFAIRAMAQTRAISRACRSAFAHVVVQIDKNLGTTPAEEMQGVYDHAPNDPTFVNTNGPAPADYIPDEDKGLVNNGDMRSMHEQTYVPAGKRPENIERTKKLVDNAIATMGLSGQTVAHLDKFMESNTKEFGWVKKHIPAEFERLEKAYMSARDAAEARAG
jgi:hypothetical protein